MGLLNLFKSRDTAAAPAPLPSGSFTVDRAGEILTSTIPSNFPASSLKQISSLVLKTFREAQDNQFACSEIVLNFGAMNMKARELRGGAIIFLSPRGNARK
jgi:hypothetical protein